MPHAGTNASGGRSKAGSGRVTHVSSTVTSPEDAAIEYFRPLASEVDVEGGSAGQGAGGGGGGTGGVACTSVATTGGCRETVSVRRHCWYFSLWRSQERVVAAHRPAVARSQEARAARNFSHGESAMRKWRCRGLTGHKELSQTVRSFLPFSCPASVTCTRRHGAPPDDVVLTDTESWTEYGGHDLS